MPPGPAGEQYATVTFTYDIDGILHVSAKSSGGDYRERLILNPHLHLTPEEQRRMFGDAIVDHERIVVNDAFKPEDFVHVCTLPSGADFEVNRLAVDCDLLVTEGFIEPTSSPASPAAARASSPASAPRSPSNENHSYKAIASPYSAGRASWKRTQSHEDMVAAARAVNVQFTFNVALDGEKKIIAAFCGDLVESHEKGVEFIRSLSQCPSITGDIVVTSNGGYPLDQNLYQSPKAVATAEACAGEDGVIIMCCSCADGMGGTHFEKLITMGTVDEIDGYLSKIPPKETIPEQWCPQIYARILKKHPVTPGDHLPPPGAGEAGQHDSGLHPRRGPGDRLPDEGQGRQRRRHPRRGGGAGCKGIKGGRYIWL